MAIAHKYDTVQRCSYRLAQGETLDEFHEECDKLSKKGFFPHGDPFTCRGGFGQGFRKTVTLSAGREVEEWIAQ